MNLALPHACSRAYQEEDSESDESSPSPPRTRGSNTASYTRGESSTTSYARGESNTASYARGASSTASYTSSTTSSRMPSIGNRSSTRPPVAPPPGSSHKVYLLISFGKSPPPQNRQLVVLICKSNQFCWGVDLLNQSINKFWEIKVQSCVAHRSWGGAHRFRATEQTCCDIFRCVQRKDETEPNFVFARNLKGSSLLRTQLVPVDLCGGGGRSLTLVTCLVRSGVLAQHLLYRSTSLRKRTPLGPNRRPMPRVVGGSSGCERFLMGEVPP